jgi:hypothetical protein
MSVKNFVLFFVVDFTDMQGSGRGLIGICLCGLRKTKKNHSLRSVLAEIRTKHLLITSLVRYSYIRPLGAFFLSIDLEPQIIKYNFC